jgi:ribosomal protein L37AE/L43A
MKKNTYDLSLPVVFDCPQCGKPGKLRGGEAQLQTPKEFLPQILSFQCPACQTKIKARVDSGHWLRDAAGRQFEFFLKNAQLA